VKVGVSHRLPRRMASSTTAPNRRSHEEERAQSLQSVSEAHSPNREESPPAASSRTKAPLAPSWLTRLRDAVWAQIEDLFEVRCPRMHACVMQPVIHAGRMLRACTRWLRTHTCKQMQRQ
jgi:hypothetical protein